MSISAVLWDDRSILKDRASIPTLLLPQLMLKFSSNILQIEYQMLILAHTDLRKYEVKRGISSHILQMGDIANQFIFRQQT